MKSKTTLQWAESFLKELLQDIKDEGSGPDNVDSITRLLQFHSTQLQDSASQRLALLEQKVSILETDASIQGMRGKR